MRAVTAAVIERDGAILVARRAPGHKLAGLWEFPGGKVEDGESLEECLRRELVEELGISCSIGTVVAGSECHHGDYAIRLIALRATILTGEISLTAPQTLPARQAAGRAGGGRGALGLRRRAVGLRRPGRCLRRRAAQPRGRRAQRATYL